MSSKEVNVWKLINQLQPLLGKMGKTLTQLDGTITYMEDIGLKCIADQLKEEKERIKGLFLDAIRWLVESGKELPSSEEIKRLMEEKHMELKEGEIRKLTDNLFVEKKDGNIIVYEVV